MYLVSYFHLLVQWLYFENGFYHSKWGRKGNKKIQRVQLNSYLRLQELLQFIHHSVHTCSSSSLYPSGCDTSKSCEIPYSKRRYDFESSKYDSNLLLEMLLLFFNMYVWTLIFEKQFKNTFFFSIRFQSITVKRVPFGFRNEPDGIFPGLRHMFHSHFHILH